MSSEVKIKTINGTPRLMVNGEFTSSITYHNRQNAFYDYMKQFADSGSELFFSYYVRNWNDTWEKHFSKVEKQLDTILAFNDRIHVILGVYLSASLEWARENPDELCRLDGNPCMDLYRVANTEKFKNDSGCVSAKYSFASDKFDEVSSEHINRTLDFLETYRMKNRVIGLFFGGGTTHEWNAFLPDQGPSAVNAFQRYLKEKYGSESKLRKAWHDKNASFAGLRPPSQTELQNTEIGFYRDPAGNGRRLVDWNLAMAEAKSRRILNAGQAVKDRRPDMITGCFHGNFFKDDGITSRIIESEALDFLVSPPQYHARCPGQHMQLNQATDSLRAHGKLFFSEEDVFSFNDKSNGFRNRKPHVRLPFQGDASSLDDTLAVYEKGLGYTIAKGTMAWYYHFQEEFFKREKRYFKMNRMMNKISLLNMKKKCRSNSEILVLTDNMSFSWLKPGTRVIQKQVDRELTFEFGYIGAPYDHMLIDSIDHLDLSKYKLICLLNSHFATEKQRESVEKLKSGGRTILFGHGAGFLTDTGAGVENMKRFTGFDFEQLNIECATTVTMIDTPNPVNRFLPAGYTFGQSYRAKRMRNDTKGNPIFPPPANSSPVFAVADPKSVDIGFYNLELPADYKVADRTGAALSYGMAGLSQWPKYFTGMALKEHKNWNAIYAGTTTIPSALLRAVCKYAGVHVYLESEDVFYCNNKFLVLHTSAQSGSRELRFPGKTDVYDLKTNRKLGTKTTSLTLKNCPARRTWLLWMDNNPPFGKKYEK